MPLQIWEYDCGCTSGVAERSTCAVCGAHGRPLGWRPTLVERMEAFSNATGIVRSLPDWDSYEGSQLLDRLVVCALCEGEAIIQSAERGRAWGWCPWCKGNGMALDGHFEPAQGKIEAMTHWILRLAAVGYKPLRRSTRRDQGALDAHELASLQAQISKQVPEGAPLIPAVHDLGATMVAVGPTHHAIHAVLVDRLRLRSPEPGTTRGFIDIDEGHFLDVANAMVRARSAGLVESESTRLRAEWLPYHRKIAVRVVRGRLWS